jgi:hypothetical protein
LTDAGRIRARLYKSPQSSGKQPAGSVRAAFGAARGAANGLGLFRLLSKGGFAAMFREVIFYDSYTKELSSSWWLYLLEGISLILLGVLILLMPQLLVGLAAGFLFLVGVLSVALALRVRRLRKRYEQWKRDWWIPVTT